MPRFLKMQKLLFLQSTMVEIVSGEKTLDPVDLTHLVHAK